ncbi:MAG: hypothetical protein IID40_09225, partial [Planctomycetes bacterium]|nr:hypothetical protein [Planctomycetota bacterium]
IYVQGEQRQTVREEEMLEALLAECRTLAQRIEAGQAQLVGALVNIQPPEPA